MIEARRWNYYVNLRIALTSEYVPQVELGANVVLIANGLAPAARFVN